MSAGVRTDGLRAHVQREETKGIVWNLSATGACTAAENSTRKIDGIVEATFSYHGTTTESVLAAHVTLVEGSDYISLIRSVTDEIIPRLEVSAGVIASEKRIEFSVAAPESELTATRSAPSASTVAAPADTVAA